MKLILAIIKPDKLDAVKEALNRVEVFRLDRGRYGPPLSLQPADRLSSPLLPGFDLPVSEVIGPSEADRPEQA